MAVGSFAGNQEPRRPAACLGEGYGPAEIEAADHRRRRQLLDTNDAHSSEPEPVENRGARRRNRKHGAEPDDEHRECDRDRPAPRTPLAKAPPHSRSEIRRRRELDLPPELD